MRFDEQVADLSEGQHGVFTRCQLREIGLSTTEIRRLVDSHRCVPIGPVVLRHRGAPETAELRALAAVLDAGDGAAVSHWSAADLWGLPASPPPEVHVVAPGRSSRRTPTVGIVHEPRTPLDGHRVVVRGIPVTTPARTLCDLAHLAGVHMLRLERLVDIALSRSLTTVPRLRRTLDDVARRGRRGVVAMRAIVEAREAGLPPTESGLEFRFKELARRAGLSGFERQVDCGDDEDWVGRVDFVHRPSRLIVECDTALHHGELTDRARDAARRERLGQAGWFVEAFTDVDLFHRADLVVARLHALLRSSNLALVG